MPSKSYAIEWLGLASKNLETADLLFKENHYTDVIGIEIQQALEKIFKALQAYNNISIEKPYLLRVFVNTCKEPWLIITVYKTSKIEKYHES